MDAIRRRITYEAGTNVYIVVETDGHKEPSVRSSSDIKPNDWNAVGCFLEVLKCLQKGLDIDRHFNPAIANSRDLELVKCQWTRTGRLKLVEENPTTKFMHAEGIAEALDRKRNFTCTRKLYEALPSYRA